MKQQSYNIMISYRMVLSVNTKNGKLKTQMIQSANIPYATLYVYLPILINRGLIQEIEYPNRHSRYKITTKGVQFLLAVEKVLSFLEDTKNINTR